MTDLSVHKKRMLLKRLDSYRSSSTHPSKLIGQHLLLVLGSILLALLIELTIGKFGAIFKSSLTGAVAPLWVTKVDGFQHLGVGIFRSERSSSEITLQPDGRHIDLLSFRLQPHPGMKLVIDVVDHEGKSRRLQPNPWISWDRNLQLKRSVIRINAHVKAVRLVVYAPGVVLDQLTFETSESINFARYGVLTSLLMLVFYGCALATWFKDSVENAAAGVLLAFGGAIIATAPYTHLGWDEYVHYQRIKELAGISEAARYDVFSDSYMPPWSKSFGEQKLINLGHALMRRTDERNKGDPIPLSVSVGPTVKFFHGYMQLGYLPNMVGLKLSHLLDLPIHVSYKAGRLTGFVFYTILVTLAVCVAPAGKLLFLAVALLPTNVFIATTYTYDAWLIGWILLGLAFMVKVLLYERPSRGAAWCILLAFFVGISSKVVYVVFMLLPIMVVFVIRDVLSWRLRYGITTSLLTLFAFSSFALPMLIDGSGSGDVRGGVGVNPGGQLEFMLVSPGTFFQVLAIQLVEYLSPSNLLQLFGTYGVLGSGWFGGVLVVIVSAIALSEEDVVKSLRIRSALIVLILSITVLVIAALYVVFNPVGAMKVDGLQVRYLLVLVMPVMMLLTGKYWRFFSVSERLKLPLLVLVPVIGVIDWWIVVVSEMY